MGVAGTGGAQSPLEFSLLNDWQRDFPLVEEPYQAMADRLSAGGGDSVSGEQVVAALARLRDGGSVSRVGAVFAPRRVGASTLAAMAVPPERLEAVADLVSACKEVNHNYQREHHFNLWFVAAAADRTALEAALTNIESKTECAVLSMPLEHEYHIDLGFDLGNGQAEKVRHAQAHAGPARDPDVTERALIEALQPGLELCSHPFARLAQRCGLDESEVLRRIRVWLDEGMIKRFGVVVRHHELGFNANAMVVFDVPDNDVDTVGALLAGEPGVTLCYRRRRNLPAWPYNLYCMVHGRARSEAQPVIERLGQLAGRPGLPLFSTRRFKQCGARYFAPTPVPQVAHA